MAKKIILAVLLVLNAGMPLYSAQDRQPLIRVSLLQDVPSFFLRVKGSFEVRDLNSKKLIKKAANLRKQAVKVRNNKINIQGIASGLLALQIAPLRGGYVFINNRIFRGKINIIIKANGKILVVNELKVEDYCAGVIAQEIAPWWPMDALKAQAIIARSYALYQKQLPRDNDFDLTSDIYSQVYGGKLSERWRTNRAVSLTKGKVLTYQGKPFPTYYHATCGGRTEDAACLWDIDLVPLRGVACNFCTHSPHYKWQAKIPLEDIRLKLITKGFQIQEIAAIEITGYDPSGRITGLEIKSQDDGFTISLKDFRQALGPNIIRSANFTMQIDRGIVHFEGLGWGHGVGLCQWGMHRMAQEAYKYEQILQYYFPQSKLTRIYTD